jgi:flavin-dependent dehydrogenase
MKIAIVGAGTAGLALAAHVAKRAVQLGVEAEARQATPAEEKHCHFIVPVAVEQQFIVEPLAKEFLWNKF